MNVPIEKKLKKAFKGKKMRKQELCTFEKGMFQNPRTLHSLLMITMCLLKAMTAEAQNQT